MISQDIRLIVERLRELVGEHGGMTISAITGQGTRPLLDRIERALFRSRNATDHAEERASEAYACEGRRIVTRRPERPDEDWNDVLMRRVRAAA